MRLLFIDTETGGIDPQKHALLSIGLVVWDNGSIIASKEILIKQGDKSITQRSLNINKIDCAKHNQLAVTQTTAIKYILDFIKVHFGEAKVTCAGHNVSFDISFVKQMFKNNKRSFENYFSHRLIDTSSILSFLYLSGKVPYQISSSAKAFDYYGISVNGRHTAIGDAIATVELFEKLLSTVQNTND